VVEVAGGVDEEHHRHRVASAAARYEQQLRHAGEQNGERDGLRVTDNLVIDPEQQLAALAPSNGNVVGLASAPWPAPPPADDLAGDAEPGVERGAPSPPQSAVRAHGREDLRCRVERLLGRRPQAPERTAAAWLLVAEAHQRPAVPDADWQLVAVEPDEGRSPGAAAGRAKGAGPQDAREPGAEGIPMSCRLRVVVAVEVLAGGEYCA
jgi:hypothetical protein